MVEIALPHYGWSDKHPRTEPACPSRSSRAASWSSGAAARSSRSTTESSRAAFRFHGFPLIRRKGQVNRADVGQVVQAL